MSSRYLFGPVNAAFAHQYLDAPRQAGHCLAFGPEEGLDLTIGRLDSWDAVCRCFPSGWQPDFIALYVPYTSPPPCLWSAPLPLIGLACDWNLLWHHYRRILPHCELVLTDSLGVATRARAGLRHARPANLYGLGRDFLDEPWPEGERDIDLLFGDFSKVGAVNRAWSEQHAASSWSAGVWGRAVRGACPAPGAAPDALWS